MVFLSKIIKIIKGINLSVVIGTLIAGTLVCIISYNLYEAREKKLDKTVLESHLIRAGKLEEDGLYSEAVAVLYDLFKEVSDKKHSEIYAEAKDVEGRCFGKLSLVNNKEDNVKKSIRSFEEALKVRTIEKYPINYANTHNNLGNSYIILSQVRNKEDNLKKAIRAFEETLNIYTANEYSIINKIVQKNLRQAINSLEKNK
jgi:tetratricopeptide (TPR) repeat protein